MLVLQELLMYNTCIETWKGKQMKLILTTILAAGVATSAAAQDVHVRDHFKNHTVKIPHEKLVCETVNVPIYGNSGETFDQDGAIVGGIVGGLLGNTIGKGNGNKAAIGIGALSGAIIGGKKSGQQQVVGYKQVENCNVETKWETKQENRYSHSTATFYHDGKKYNLDFYK
jgi:outer membrane lipoprotein SlyB